MRGGCRVGRWILLYCLLSIGEDIPVRWNDAQGREASLQEGATMAIKAKMVLMNNQGHCEGWMRAMILPIPPFPGLGIRIDTYEMLNVEKVAIEHDGYDVTCFVRPDGPVLPGAKPLDAEAFGFQPSAHGSQSLPAPQDLRYIERMREKAESAEKRSLQAGIFFENAEGSWWSKMLEMPFPPFAGLEVHLGGRILKIWNIVIGDRLHDVTCLVEPVPFTNGECEALGFEEALYPY
jgi:hypothetical protein